MSSTGPSASAPTLPCSQLAGTWVKYTRTGDNSFDWNAFEHDENETNYLFGRVSSAPLEIKTADRSSSQPRHAYVLHRVTCGAELSLKNLTFLTAAQLKRASLQFTPCTKEDKDLLRSYVKTGDVCVTGMDTKSALASLSQKV